MVEDAPLRAVEAAPKFYTPIVDMAARTVEYASTFLPSRSPAEKQKDIQPMAITDNGAVIAQGGDAAVAKTEPASTRKPLSSETLESAQVKSKEGYFQSAKRLLGDDFTHNETMQFVKSLKQNFKEEHPGQKDLKRGDALLTEKNRDAVIGGIADEGLRKRIGDKINGAPTDVVAAPPKVANEVAAVVDSKDGKKLPDTGDQVKVEGEKEKLAVDKPLKSAYLKRYEPGDKFSGLTSEYGSGRTTASGLPFRTGEMTAAHKDLPFGTVLNIKNPDTGIEKKIVITDHGPFAGQKVKRPDANETTYSRVLDLSTGAAKALGGVGLKHLEVTIDYIPPNAKWGDARRNIHGAERAAVEANVRRYSRRA
jgi:rare lipoprotein A (peptidoglycan hydrolase)